jgi:Cys-tRNA(Pro) deacylase
VHRNVDLVVQAGLARGFDVRPREFPEGTRTAADAAAAIGVQLGQIVKTLVFLVDGAPVVALMSGSNRLDEARLARASGGTRARRADAQAAREATGFPIGGVPPFGHRTAVPVFVDRDLLAFDEVWAACGTPSVNFAIGPAALVEATGGLVCELAARAS